MEARFIDVWVNCPDRALAQEIAAACVGEKLAACANIFPPIASVYRWKGAIERAEEVPLVLKSRAELFQALSARVKELPPLRGALDHRHRAAAGRDRLCEMARRGD